MYKTVGPEGELAQFLQDFGKTLVEKYNPRAIVVFSAHWEGPHNQTLGESPRRPVPRRPSNDGAEVTDYGAENPLLMDYYGFPDEVGYSRIQFGNIT